MRDITELIKSAIFSDVDWRFSMFYRLIDRLKERNIEFSFWENDENWISISSSGETVGYVWKKHPVIFHEGNKVPDFIEVIKEIGVAGYVEVESLRVDLFQITDESLWGYLDSSSNLAFFTAEDLWFNTNSV